ncbi:hypothetical protein MJO28_003139 [Puccinia striiformis f. sp. tritici]|uniref:Uncharacterized protein n=1 Tax=Puccinia striiformis f. sp. tritici TaxID=168172 RepID=A0ACC0ESB3_9BASI|nr:hypothetical protein Pst134EB_006029 [Puccinia striiformis f. sp. tritici]KAI7959348.1 hypothetical protein MJO28_003139 [Puccinia striiformis f. sp. tritici]KAI9631321.1 hypothetical protein KEM48_014463 [Puccinia striiformis f. sp. tritici PST-130]
MKVAQQLSSGLLILSLCVIGRGILALPTFFLPRITNVEPAGDLEHLQENVQAAKDHLNFFGLEKHYKKHLDILDDRIVRIHYLFLDKHESLSAPRDLGDKIFEEEKGLIAEGVGSALRERGERVLSNLVILLRTNPIKPEPGRDNELHDFRKSVFLAIRFMIKYNLVEKVQSHLIFQDEKIMELLWRCGLIEDELNPPSRRRLVEAQWYSPEIMAAGGIPTWLSDYVWIPIIQAFPTSIFSKATKSELLRVRLRFEARAEWLSEHPGTLWERCQMRKQENQKIQLRFPGAIDTIIAL